MSTNNQVKHQDREDIVDNSLKDQLDKIIANYAQRAANRLVSTQRGAGNVKGGRVSALKGRIANYVNEETETLFKERLEKRVVAKHMSSYNKNVMEYVANTQGEMVRAIAISSKTQSMLNDKYKDITIDIEI